MFKLKPYYSDLLLCSQDADHSTNSFSPDTELILNDRDSRLFKIVSKI